MQKYRIKEIFGPTIQGEGSMSGTVVNFLRFAGCNRWNGVTSYKEKSICSFCDTDFVGGDKLTKEEILSKLSSLGSVKTVVISGGEPTIQLDESLCQYLVENGYVLHLETNGSNNIDHIAKYFTHITVSPKQSFAETKLSFANDLKILWPAISPEITPDHFKDFKSNNRFLQPVYGDVYDPNLKETIDKLINIGTWRLSLQTHKIIGVQ